ERLVEAVGAPLDRDAVLLHRLEQRRLRLRRRAVDFVREHDVGEDRAGRELHLPPSRPRVFLHEVGACDVGRHQVGRELDARELQVEGLRHRVDEQRLGQSRRADDEAVAADEERVQDLVDDLFLADDDLAQLAENLLAARLHLVRELDVVRRLEIDDVAGDIRVHRHAITHLAPSRVLISRVFSARSVTSFSSSLWYLAGSMLSLSSRSDSTRCSMSRCSSTSARSFGSVGSDAASAADPIASSDATLPSLPLVEGSVLPALSPLSSSTACSVDSSPSLSSARCTAAF